MKFINVSDKVKNFNINDEWVSVNPGDMVELPRKFESGLELVEVKDKPIPQTKGKAEKANGEKKDELDLNGDGVVDKKDSTLAGKVLAHASKKKKGKANKK